MSAETDQKVTDEAAAQVDVSYQESLFKWKSPHNSINHLF